MAKPAIRRVLRAKRISDGAWFQRIDSGRQDPDRFKAEVAEQFSVPENSIEVVQDEMVEANFENLAASMTPLISAPPVIRVLSPAELKKKNAREKIDAAIAEPGISPKIKDVLAALKEVLE